MTSEEIIEKLLNERKISAKEAFIILKDLSKPSIYWWCNQRKGL